MTPTFHEWLVDHLVTWRNRLEADKNVVEVTEEELAQAQEAVIRDRQMVESLEALLKGES